MDPKYSMLKGLTCISIESHAIVNDFHFVNQNFFTVYEIYYIPINDTSFELSVFWTSHTETRSTH